MLHCGISYSTNTTCHIIYRIWNNIKSDCRNAVNRYSYWGSSIRLYRKPNRMHEITIIIYMIFILFTGITSIFIKEWQLLIGCILIGGMTLLAISIGWWIIISNLTLFSYTLIVIFNTKDRR